MEWGHVPDRQNAFYLMQEGEEKKRDTLAEEQIKPDRDAELYKVLMVATGVNVLIK